MCRCVYWPSSSISEKRTGLNNKVESSETPAGDPWFSPTDFKSLLLLDGTMTENTVTAVLSNRLHLRTLFSFYYGLHLLCCISVECLLWGSNFYGDLLSSIDICVVYIADFLCVLLQNWSLQCSSINVELTDVSLYVRGLRRLRGMWWIFSARFRSAGSKNFCHVRKKHIQIEIILQNILAFGGDGRKEKMNMGVVELKL